MMPSVKLVVVGDSNVGKTTLMHRYCSGTFNPNAYLTTYVPYMNLALDGKQVHLDLWWTDESDEYDRLRPISNPHLLLPDLRLQFRSYRHQLDIRAASPLPGRAGGGGGDQGRPEAGPGHRGRGRGEGRGQLPGVLLAHRTGGDRGVLNCELHCHWLAGLINSRGIVCCHAWFEL